MSRSLKKGSEWVTTCNQLKMKAAGGNYYKTDALDAEGYLILVQSMPSEDCTVLFFI